ncbi:hypothetical protein [Geopsychrobacter electrodiphilus]|uniref:hypothetical protein n=1 Tax=Geopsychrobacter electrodiphilus TaxID=225196 RepID=UPI00037D4EED|nr:hypothetical protein [Geopsychrobacter electrodiphilus]
MKQENTHKLVAWGFFFAIGGGYFLMAAQFPLAYIVATYEDMVGEWAQVFLFAATMLLSIRVACYKSSYRLFFAILALACFYVVGEEISWGQRIFNLTTPEFFKTHNLQNETNLHNFFTGPITTTLKQTLEYLIALGLVVYGLLYPLLVAARWKIALWFDKKGLAHPPLYLWPFFVLSAYLELGFISFNEAEIAEILIPLALAIMAANYLLALRNPQALKDINRWKMIESKRLAYQTTTLALTVTLLAFATSAASYSSDLGGKIDSRYLKGLEKFADRYKRFEQWESAAQLYLLASANEPQKAAILRNLFICYSNLKDEQAALFFLTKAEQADIDFLASEPLSVGSHLSLVETYELMKDKDRAADHLRGSLDIARLNAQRFPDSASAAYWLGRAEEKTGNLSKASKEYQRAAQIRPGVLRYQKAILYLNRQLEISGHAGSAAVMALTLNVK